MSVYSTPVNINGDCIYDFPAPYRVLTDRSVSGHNNMMGTSFEKRRREERCAKNNILI